MTEDWVILLYVIGMIGALFEYWRKMYVLAVKHNDGCSKLFVAIAPHLYKIPQLEKNMVHKFGINCFILFAVIGFLGRIFDDIS